MCDVVEQKDGNSQAGQDSQAGQNSQVEKESQVGQSSQEQINQKDLEQRKNEEIKDVGQTTLESDSQRHRIHLLSIIGEIEGHECLANNTKSTKYEHVLPKLAEIQDDDGIDGVLVLINTVGGDVESGLAIAEMIASLSKPTVSLVLGGSHSIGVPLAVSTDYSYIVPTGTMVIHPVRLTGLVIGAPQTYDYFQQMQDRIVGFISDHCFAKKERLEEMMLNTGMLTKDLGTILVGAQTVAEGIINEVGGISEAMDRLHGMIREVQMM